MGKLWDAIGAKVTFWGKPVWDGLNPAWNLVEAGVANGWVWPHHTRPTLALTGQSSSERSPSSCRRTISERPLPQLSLKPKTRNKKEIFIKIARLTARGTSGSSDLLSE